MSCARQQAKGRKTKEREHSQRERDSTQSVQAARKRKIFFRIFLFSDHGPRGEGTL